jgi:hypothetical protein
MQMHPQQLLAFLKDGASYSPNYSQNYHGKTFCTIHGMPISSAATIPTLVHKSQTTMSGPNALTASIKNGYHAFKNAWSPVSPLSLVDIVI